MSKSSKQLIAILITVILFLGRAMINDKVLYQGEIVRPIQKEIKKKKEIIHSGKEGDVRLLIKEEYELTGVVKSKKKYSDFPSQISEYDLAIAWGDLNKEEVDSSIKYSQRGRWYYYRYSADCPVSQSYISKHSSNTHIIHKDKDILKEIKKIDKGDHVKLKGFLVDVDFKNSDNMPLWKTSRTRSDTGNGACEILYLEEVEVYEK